MRFVSRYFARRRHCAVEPGTRVTLGCSFLLASDWEWDDLPDECSSNWRDLQVLAPVTPKFPPPTLHEIHRLRRDHGDNHPEHDALWRKDGLALAKLRAEFAPDCNIEFPPMSMHSPSSAQRNLSTWLGQAVEQIVELGLHRRIDLVGGYQEWLAATREQASAGVVAAPATGSGG
jgi:hypothetical protein